VKRIEVEIREECVYKFSTEVEDDFPDDWTGDQEPDEKLRDQLLGAWANEGNPINDIFAVEEQTVQGWCKR
jgi:hypothetical protein